MNEQHYPALTTAIRVQFEAAPDKMAFLEEIRTFLHNLSPVKAMPIDDVRWIPIDQVQANDYNPNSVAKNEMRLLHKSISADGYTQPVVTIFDEKLGKYVIVDGFHRYTTMRVNEDIRSKTGGYLPCVVIKKDINERMAATVRHNRARGKHSVVGMASMVFAMLENGKADADICNELGLEAEELVRYKHLTGFSKLFENADYHKAWEAESQINIKKKYKADTGELPTV